MLNSNIEYLNGIVYIAYKRKCKARTNNKFKSLHRAGIEPDPHWSEASALNTSQHYGNPAPPPYYESLIPSRLKVQIVQTKEKAKLLLVTWLN